MLVVGGVFSGVGGVVVVYPDGRKREMSERWKKSKERGLIR